MMRARRSNPDAEAFVSWRFVLVAVGMLGAAGIAIAIFAWSAG